MIFPCSPNAPRRAARAPHSSCSPQRMMPSACNTPSPEVISISSAVENAAIAMRPFHVSALLVQPHCHTSTGGGSASRSRSYASSRSGTVEFGRLAPAGTEAAVIVPTYGSASSTASAMSPMKPSFSPSAGTRPHSLTPLSSASSLYSMSISSSVSMCSDTNEMGTASRRRQPPAPSSSMVASVYGLSHSTGPTRDWYASVCALAYPRRRTSAMMSPTHSSISAL
mmetsp:Transcript_13253/g.41504  ORF Transcript_13253/g.41504 Transcript_13253/m.41504 type:complete len:225 (-) Transcript_13253:824-1498(-)